MAEVTKSELARRLGVSPSAVGKAIRHGRIAAAVVRKRDGRELLDEEKAVELWGKNTLQQAPPADGSTPRQPVVAPHVPAQVSTRQLRAYIKALPEDQIPDLNESRAREKHYQAEKAKLEALRGRGELVPTDDVKKEAARLARQVRDRMLIIPARSSAMLATMQDQEQVRQLLQEEIEMALRGLADA
jgi:hypothetical protein